MKYFSLLLFFALTFSFDASAQTNQTPSAGSARTIETSPCPAFDVKVDENINERILEPRVPITFTANVGKYDLSKLSFNWIISRGEILEGQGTSSIKVLNDTDDGVTATIEIEGLPEGCVSTESEMSATICRPNARLFDEFSTLPSQIEKEKLDNLVNELGNNQNAQAFIMEYFKRGTAQKVIDRKIQKITDYLVYEKLIAKDRFTILTADSEWGQHRTKFWIVPLGASLPQP